MATWRCTFTEGYFEFTVREWSRRYPGYIYMYIHIYKHHGESLRVDVPRDLSPADPVKKLKDSETENCIRRLTRAVPGGSPRGGNVTSKIRNLNSNTHATFSSPFCLILRFPWNWYIVLIYGEVGARRNTPTHADQHRRVIYRWPCE